jgi:hypothetical protein
MIRISVHDADGRIHQVMTVRDEEEALLNVPEGGGYIAGAVDQTAYYVSGGEPVAYPPKPGPWAEFDFTTGQWFDPRDARQIAAAFAQVKRAAIGSVNAAAGKARQRYITALPGQDMIYLAKEAEALRYIAQAPETLDGYMLLAAEVGITAPDAWQLAQLWANNGQLWRMLAASIEKLRLGAVFQIEAATDETEVDAIRDAAVAALRR